MAWANMRYLLPALLLGLATASGAQAHQASTKLTCAAAAALVRQQGEVLFDTSPTTFDRYVRDGSFCPLGRRLAAAFIPTRDNPLCMAGYTCEPEIPIAPFSAPGVGR